MERTMPITQQQLEAPRQLGRRAAARELAPRHRFPVQIRAPFVRLPRRTDGGHP